MQVHISLLIICVLSSLLAAKSKKISKWILLLCMILITVYMAIRYDYGLDYWSYYDAFYNIDTHRTEKTEPLFWLFFESFSEYYVALTAISIVLMGSLYSLVSKLMPHQTYALFFLCFFCLPGMSFTMMSAMRSVMAFGVLSLGVYYFYIKRKSWKLFFMFIIFAGLFHNSAFLFLLLPFLDRLILKTTPNIFFVLFLVFSVFSFTGIAQVISSFLFNLLYNVGSIDADYYQSYATKYVSNANGAIMRGAFLFPAYFICRYAQKTDNRMYSKVYVLSVIFFSVYFLSLDLQYRFTLNLFIYVIIAIAMCLPKMKPLMKLIAILPVIVVCIFLLYSYYKLMLSEIFGVYSDGNFYYYKTIFGHFPLN